MIGILIYVYFLFIGYFYSCHLFKEKNIFFRGWMGGIFGHVILMMGIVLPAVICGFNYISHIILIVLSAAPAAWLIKKNGTGYFKEILRFNGAGETETGMDWKVFVCLILPITVIIGVLMTNHILAPYEGGGYASGQCTFGDLQMHLGFVTSIAEQGKFAPNYVFLNGYTLNYPFFVDMLSSSLYLFGTSLRWAVLIPSYIISMLIAMGFYIVAFRLTKRKAAAILATVFFFFCGGFGFSYFFEGAKADHNAFTMIFKDFYHTPTNYNEHNIRWANSICDMIIPQRTTMAGWLMIFPTLWLLLDAIRSKSRVRYITLGILAGSMPMIHTHSFLALGMICAVLFFAYLIEEKKPEDKKAYFINWVIFGGIVAVMAAPQLLYWTFRQTAGNESFLKYQFNWVNHNDPYFWFYLKNWGIAALFAVPAIMGTSKDNKKLLCGCGFIFIIAELILFQPNEYDNNKLFFIVYMILLMIVSEWLVTIWDKLKGVKGRVYLAVIVILAGTLSGALTIGREYNSGAEYQTFSEDKIAMGEYIKENTPKDAVFLTSTYHLNPVPTLAGRNIYLGSSLYVYFHGLGNEYYTREAAMKSAYSGSYENLKKFCEENGIDYVYVGSNENDLNPKQSVLNRLEKVYSVGTETLYKVQ